MTAVVNHVTAIKGANQNFLCLLTNAEFSFKYHTFVIHLFDYK